MTFCSSFGCRAWASVVESSLKKTRGAREYQPLPDQKKSSSFVAPRISSNSYPREPRIWSKVLFDIYLFLPCESCWFCSIASRSLYKGDDVPSFDLLSRFLEKLSGSYVLRYRILVT